MTPAERHRTPFLQMFQERLRKGETPQQAGPNRMPTPQSVPNSLAGPGLQQGQLQNPLDPYDHLVRPPQTPTHPGGQPGFPGAPGGAEMRMPLPQGANHLEHQNSRPVSHESSQRSTPFSTPPETPQPPIYPILPQQQAGNNGTAAPVPTTIAASIPPAAGGATEFQPQGGATATTQSIPTPLATTVSGSASQPAAPTLPSQSSGTTPQAAETKPKTEDDDDDDVGHADLLDDEDLLSKSKFISHTLK